MSGGFGAPERPLEALTEASVKLNMPFVTYRLGEGDSRRRGTFASRVYTSADPIYNEGRVVNVKWHDCRETTEVASSLGLCRNRYTGEYERGVCLEDDSE